MRSAKNDATIAVINSLIGVTVFAGLLAWPAVYSNIFDEVSTDLELSHYAEKAGWAHGILPEWMLLPMNTFVNVGYVVVGAMWMLRVWKHRDNSDNYHFYVFCWMSIIYGHVQCVRIVTRFHWAAVLDQWYTFPIFAWVGVWSANISCRARHGCALGWVITTAAMLASVLSYGLALLHELGFEVALGLHILIVVALSWQAHCVAPAATRKRRERSIAKAIVSCSGFVVLKLADHRLAALCPSFFTIFSGHFWSKVADFMQIHYTCQFFSEALQIKLVKSR